MKKNVSPLPDKYLVASPPMAPSIKLACAASDTPDFDKLIDQSYPDLNIFSA